MPYIVKNLNTYEMSILKTGSQVPNDCMRLTYSFKKQIKTSYEKV